MRSMTVQFITDDIRFIRVLYKVAGDLGLDLRAIYGGYELTVYTTVQLQELGYRLECAGY